MLQRLSALGLFAALALTVNLFAADDPNAKKKTDPATQTPLDSDKLTAGEYTGTLLTTPGSDGSFTLQIDNTYLTPKNPAQLAARQATVQGHIQGEQTKIAGLQAQLVNTTKPQQAAQLQTKLQQANAQLQKYTLEYQPKPSELKTVTDSKVYDMKLKDEADIRYLNLPEAFDDMGKAKVYTAAEKKELKGKKTTLPGYEGKLDDLKVGQTVKVTLVRVYAKKTDDSKKTDTTKPAADDAKNADPKPDDAKKDTAANPDKKDDGDKPPPEKKMQAKMIVIVKDAPDTSDSKDPKKKKKNNN